jgi:CubicO group peptidase (beta-lactamase class C family)
MFVILSLFLMLAQSPPPPQPQGQISGTLMVQGKAVIAAINRGDSAEAFRMVQTRLSARALAQRSPESYAGLLMALFRQSGGVRLKRAEPLGSGAAFTLWAKNADRGTLLFLAADGGDSSTIGRLDVFRFFHPAATVRALPPLVAGKPQFLSALRAELNRLTVAGEFAGTVVVTRGDTVLFQQGYGRSVLPAGEMNGAATHFHLASVGKMFTATAIGQLMETHRISFDDSLAKLLPQFSWAHASRGITVRQLLSHTSGLGQAERAGDAIDSAFAAAPPAFTPGSRFSYSNDGYEILGLIIERVTGESYQDYVRKRVLRPAGMTDTDAYPVDQPLAHRAIGYGHREDDYFGSEPPVSNVDKVKGRGTAAGGSYGTARDLSLFAMAIVSGSLIGNAMLDTLTAPRWPLPGPYPDERYGYGFESYEVNGSRVVGHGGGGEGWGICSRLDFLPERGYSVAVLSNLDPPTCMDVSRAIVAAIAGEKASGKD